MPTRLRYAEVGQSSNDKTKWVGTFSILKHGMLDSLCVRNVARTICEHIEL